MRDSGYVSIGEHFAISIICGQYLVLLKLVYIPIHCSSDVLCGPPIPYNSLLYYNVLLFLSVSWIVLKRGNLTGCNPVEGSVVLLP